MISVSLKQNLWQVCDTKSHAKGKKDNHFLIGVSEREFSARWKNIKQKEQYPLWASRSWL